MSEIDEIMKRVRATIQPVIDREAAAETVPVRVLDSWDSEPANERGVEVSKETVSQKDQEIQIASLKMQVNVLMNLLVSKGILTDAEIAQAVYRETDQLKASFRERFGVDMPDISPPSPAEA